MARAAPTFSCDPSPGASGTLMHPAESSAWLAKVVRSGFSDGSNSNRGERTDPRRSVRQAAKCRDAWKLTIEPQTCGTTGDLEGVSQSRDPHALGEAAAQRQVGLHEIEDAVRDVVPVRRKPEQRLAARQPHRQFLGQAAVAGQVVMDNWFLEPDEIGFRQPRRDVQRALHGEAFVEVDHERHLRADQVADAARQLTIPPRLRAHSHLDRPEPGPKIRLDVDEEVPIGIAARLHERATDIGRDLRAQRAAKKRVNRASKRQSRSIP